MLRARARIFWGAEMRLRVWLLLLMILALAAAADAQRRDRRQPAKQADSSVAAVLPDDQRIEGGISQMLAAWQLGDAGLLHEHYAEDVVVVSGAYEPPIVGWTAFAQGYVRLMQRMQGVRVDRRNTLIRTQGNLAWVTYQWEMQAILDGAPTFTRGHTTLVLEKRGGNWLIVHNHTSVVPQ
jgi:uncharacterized protein (TIGR02246 family)